MAGCFGNHPFDRQIERETLRYLDDIDPDQSWVYIQSEFFSTDGCDLFTVGFYDPSGKWHPESDYNTREEAAKRVHYLNGGND